MQRVRKSFDTQIEAEIFERETFANNRIKKLQNTDPRHLSELISLWYKYHGINLADGEKMRNRLNDVSKALNNPKASSITPEQFVNYRANRISKGLNSKTFNNHHGYLSAMYNKLRKLKVIDYNNPVGDIDFIKIQQRMLSYLSINQINTLLNSIQQGCDNKSTWFVTQICLRTGARWGEAEQLKRKQIHNNSVTFEFTKSKKIRTVPLDEDFLKQLKIFMGNKTPEQRIFTNCIGAFRRAVIRAKIELPKGQNTHILRHSFASHFMMNGGNILTLQIILGHSDIRQTMKYAHLAPDHLLDALILNPVASSIPKQGTKPK